MRGKYGEPWHFYYGSHSIWERGQQQQALRAVCTLHGPREIDSRQKANGRRICLAVNACAGLSDAALEAGVVGAVRNDLEFALREQNRGTSGRIILDIADEQRLRAALASLTPEQEETTDG